MALRVAAAAHKIPLEAAGHTPAHDDATTPPALSADGAEAERLRAENAILRARLADDLVLLRELQAAPFVSQECPPDVGACKVAAEDAFECLHKGSVSKNKLEQTVRSVSKNKLEQTLKNMCKEGAYWGAAAGLYVGVEYGLERIRGRYDWKNALIGGVVSGAIISAAGNSKADKIAKDAITAGALATAVEFINYLT